MLGDLAPHVDATGSRGPKAVSVKGCDRHPVQ